MAAIVGDIVGLQQVSPRSPLQYIQCGALVNVCKKVNVTKNLQYSVAQKNKRRVDKPTN